MIYPPVLFEDNHVLVAVKPPRMLTQGDKTGDTDLLSVLKAYVKEKYDKPGDAYLGLVHRMDRPVGGLLVFARTSKAAARFAAQLKDGMLKREYVLVCEGETPDRFMLKNYLVKDETSNTVRVLPQHLKIQGKEAVLYGSTVAHSEKRSLAAVQLQTGRAHQIRVQMAHFGHPLLGDARYNEAFEGGLIALWGMKLRFLHPITGKAMSFVCAPEVLPPPYERSPHFAPYARELDGLTRVWPEIAP